LGEPSSPSSVAPRSTGIGDHRRAVAHAQQPVVGDGADAVGVQAPAREQRLGALLLAARQHDQHPLLRLGQHHLVGRHPRLAAAHPRHVQLDAAAAARRQLGARAGQPRRAEVLHRHDLAARQQL
jgi:hypothetical protein